MGDHGRCELIDGRIVRTSPTNHRHGRVEYRVAKALGEFVGSRHLGEVMTGEVGIYTRRNPDRVRGADVIFLSKETYARQPAESAFLQVAPELVVEILSPEDRAVNVNQKLREYFTIGVKLVWLVDPEARAVSTYRSVTDVREFREADYLGGDDVLPGLELQVASLFEEQSLGLPRLSPRCGTAR